MQQAVCSLAASCLFTSLAVLLVLAESSQTVWGGPPGEAKATGSLTVDINPDFSREQQLLTLSPDSLGLPHDGDHTRIAG